MSEDYTYIPDKMYLHLREQLVSAKIISITDDTIELIVERTEEIQIFPINSTVVVFRGMQKIEISLIDLKPYDKICEIRSPLQ
jgi:hypothetical protein